MIDRAKLYLVMGTTLGVRELERFLGEVLDAGVDAVQLREKQPESKDSLLAIAEVFRRLTAQSGALFIVNDYPDVAVVSGADGLHVGQEDMNVDEARSIVGPGILIGLSTHSEADIAEARGADYLGVGPVFETPTKPGRSAVGLDLVRHAAGAAAVPWFAIGGIDPDSLPAVIEAGARRVAVVRALTEAPDPGRVARKMRLLLDRAM